MSIMPRRLPEGVDKRCFVYCGPERCNCIKAGDTYLDGNIVKSYPFQNSRGDWVEWIPWDEI